MPLTHQIKANIMQRQRGKTGSALSGDGRVEMGTSALPAGM